MLQDQILRYQHMLSPNLTIRRFLGSTKGLTVWPGSSRLGQCQSVVRQPQVRSSLQSKVAEVKRVHGRVKSVIHHKPMA